MEERSKPRRTSQVNEGPHKREPSSMGWATPFGKASRDVPHDPETAAASRDRLSKCRRLADFGEDARLALQLISAS
jgi:hypothetical protein